MYAPVMPPSAINAISTGPGVLYVPVASMYRRRHIATPSALMFATVSMFSSCPTFFTLNDRHE